MPQLITLFVLATLALPLVEGECNLKPILKLSEGETTATFRLNSRDPLGGEQVHDVTEWRVQGSNINVYYGWRRSVFTLTKAYTLQCALRTNGLVLFMLATDDDGDQAGRRTYICFDITMRGSSVFQLKFSLLLASTSPPVEICDRSTMPDYGLTFVRVTDSAADPSHRVRYTRCSIDGGYAIERWTDQTGSSKCEQPRGQGLRVEAECDKGEGVVFTDGWSAACRGPLHGEIHPSEKLQCYASWTHQGFSFSVARAESSSATYCMRAPVNEEDARESEIYIFKDGICDFTQDITLSKEFLKLDLVRWQIPTICSDVSPWCDLGPTERTKEGIFCADTLRLCGAHPSSPDVLIDSKLRGDWVRETAALGSVNVHVSRDEFDFGALGKWRLLRKEECDTARFGIQEKGNFYFVLSLSDRGCQPRLARLVIIEFNGSVIGYQLSHSRALQPFANETYISGWDPRVFSLCRWSSDLQFGETDPNLLDNFHVSPYGWYNLVKKSEAGLAAASCDISKWKHMRATLGEGQSCSLRLDQGADMTSFEVVVESCDVLPEHLSVEKPVRHTCLAMYKGPYGWTTFIITRTPDDQTNLAKVEYLCWIFSNEEPHGLLMRTGDCHEETMSEVREDKSKTALAEFTTVAAVVGEATSVNFQQTSVFVGSPSCSLILVLISRFWHSIFAML